MDINMISKLLNILTLSPKYLFAVFLATGFMVFGKKEYLEQLGLQVFASSYKFWIGLIFILSTAVLIGSITFGFGGIIWRKFQSRQYIKQRKKKLSELTPDEKAYILPYIIDDTNTQYFSMDDGISRGLEAKGIIYCASNLSKQGGGFAYNIQPWARDYLK